jgi:hypothetical protein
MWADFWSVNVEVSNKSEKWWTKSGIKVIINMNELFLKTWNYLRNVSMSQTDANIGKDNLKWDVCISKDATRYILVKYSWQISLKSKSEFACGLIIIDNYFYARLSSPFFRLVRYFYIDGSKVCPRCLFQCLRLSVTLIHFGGSSTFSGKAHSWMLSCTQGIYMFSAFKD